MIGSGRQSIRGMIWFGLFALIFLFYYFTYYLPFNFNQLSGDAMCHIAYWRSLFNPLLRGSIGAAATKPGWAIALGSSHSFYYTFGESDLLLKFLLVLSVTSLVWIITRISTDIGGWIAGTFSFVFAISNPTILQGWYRYAQSHLFALPLLMLGLWLYSNQREKSGILLLALSIFFRIELALVFLFICAYELFKRNYKKFFILGAVLTVTLIIWFSFVLLIQGKLSRWDSGVGVGYNMINKEKNYLNISNSLSYYFGAWRNYFRQLRGEVFLLPFILYSIISAKKYRIYAVVIGIFATHFLNILLLGGSSFPHYISAILPFTLSLGIGGLFLFTRMIIRNGRIDLKFRVLGVFLPAVILGNLFFSNRPSMEDTFNSFFKRDEIMEFRKVAGNPFVINAVEIIETKIIPAGSNLLTEDDIIYSLVVNSPPEYFGRMTALPYFTICSEQEREEILKNVNYVYISKLPHLTFYLFESILIDWKKDDFSANIRNLLSTGQSFDMYSVSFSFLEELPCGFLIKVTRIMPVGRQA